MMPPKQQTDPLPAPTNNKAPVRRFLLRETEREGFETDSQCVSWMFTRNIGPFTLSNPLVRCILCHRVRYPPSTTSHPVRPPFPVSVPAPFPRLPQITTNGLSLQRTRPTGSLTPVGLYNTADLVRLKVECGPQRSADNLCEARPDVT